MHIEEVLKKDLHPLQKQIASNFWAPLSTCHRSVILYIEILSAKTPPKKITTEFWAPLLTFHRSLLLY
jgi:hypothetical protein